MVTGVDLNGNHQQKIVILQELASFRPSIWDKDAVAFEGVQELLLLKDWNYLFSNDKNSSLNFIIWALFAMQINISYAATKSAESDSFGPQTGKLLWKHTAGTSAVYPPNAGPCKLQFQCSTAISTAFLCLAVSGQQQCPGDASPNAVYAASASLQLWSRGVWRCPRA